MNLDFDTIEIPEEKLNRTIQNNIKKVHGIHRKQMIRHTAGLFCAAAFFFCLSAQIICEPEENSRHEQRYPPYI